MTPTLRAQPIMAEEVWRQGCETAGYLASEVGKRGGVRAGAQLTFFKSEISANGNGATHSQNGLPLISEPSLERPSQT